MSKPVIEINNLSKIYSIGHNDNVDRNSFTETIVRTLKKPTEILTGHRIPQEKFWALKNVDLNIQRGDVVGLIGRNGSGKSTLLKILSRIVEPSQGEITLRGNTASLLEVGTGFHPELTGRENIYFNGSILGMSRKEIESKFDEIVAFSEIERFLDTPVKFYSSGMYVRLAFAVAAHLEPDILIVDEVLAVGDAEFQKKSLGKMRDSTQNSDRTVIFVSHSMTAIESICNKCIWLNEGQIMMAGDTGEVVDAYSNAADAQSLKPLSERKNRKGTGKVRATNINIVNTILENKQVAIEVELENYSKVAFNDAKLSLDIYDQSGVNISNILNDSVEKTLNFLPGRNKITVTIKDFNLVPGRYSVNIFAASDKHNTEIFDWVEYADSFNVPPYDYYQSGQPPIVNGKTVYLDYDFTNAK